MRPTPRFLPAVSILFATAIGLGACGEMPDGSPSGGEHTEFVQAIPKAHQVAINVPGVQAVQAGDEVEEHISLAEAAEAVSLNGIRMFAEDMAGAPRRASFYQVTWDVSKGVNTFVFALIAMIKEVDTWPATTETQTSRTWGPWTEALSPSTLRFTISKEEPGTLAFDLQAKPKRAEDDAYQSVLWGRFVGAEAGRGHGEFHIDADAARAADPNGDGGTGRLDIVWSNYVVPRTVDLALVNFADKAGDPTGNAAYHYREASDGSGVFEFIVDGDLDKDADPSKPAKEKLGIVSRWLSTGAGRADVVVSGGDLPWPSAHAEECWDQDFWRVYYADDRDLAPGEGDPEACELPSL